MSLVLMNSAKTEKSLWTIDDGAMLMVGNLKVGKSTLFARLVKNRFHPITRSGDDVMLHVSDDPVANGKQLIDIPGVYSLYDRSEDAAAIRLLVFMKKDVQNIKTTRGKRKWIALFWI